jgi:hypothetical protein
MHIAPTGFPGHLNGYRFFPSKHRGVLIGFGPEFISPCPSVALDPDQFLDDIFNRLKLCEAALGNDAMRGTIGLFKHCAGAQSRRSDPARAS